MTIEERLAKLEHQLRRVKRRNCWQVAAVIFLALLLLAPFVFEVSAFRAKAQVAGAAKEIRVQSIVVEDAKGNARIKLDLFMNEPILEFLDNKGKPRVSLGMVQDMEGLWFSDENSLLVSLVASKDGTNLSMLNGKGKPSVALANWKNTPALVISDENNKGSVRMMVLKDGPKLSLLDANGDRVWSALK